MILSSKLTRRRSQKHKIVSLKYPQINEVDIVTDNMKYILERKQWDNMMWEQYMGTLYENPISYQ